MRYRILPALYTAVPDSIFQNCFSHPKRTSAGEFGRWVNRAGQNTLWMAVVWQHEADVMASSGREAFRTMPLEKSVFDAISGF